MYFDGPENGEALNSASETMYRRLYAIDSSIEIAEQNPIVRRNRLEPQPVSPQPEQVAPVVYANFGRSAVEQVDTTNRLESAQQDLERIYGDQKAA
jgi:hypothetical protein